MKSNSRLSLALHTLGHMAGDPDRVRTSADIAEHAGTNPVVVRRVLGRLRSAGLLLSEKGHAGGWRLARAPKDISLADIYLALEENLVASEHALEGANCSVDLALRRRVTSLLNDAERHLVERLAETSIADVPGLPHETSG
ncbi:MAG: Rrf2 family transcriptional regulator [Pseudomonadota bacterium]